MTHGPSSALREPELLIGPRVVSTVFGLLGTNENDLTYSLGWGLRCSAGLRDELLGSLVGGGEVGDVLAIRLQQHGRDDRGFTDVEIETTRGLLIIEAKAGYDLPAESQLSRYQPRFADHTHRLEGGWTRLVVLSGWDADQGAARISKPDRGFPVSYLPWRDLVGLVRQVAASSRRPAERSLLRELATYLAGGTAVRDTSSNRVYVVSLSAKTWQWLPGSFIDFSEGHRMYFHPAGGGWPKEPPNYLGFRYRAALQSIHHIDDYKLITRPHDHLPFTLGSEWADWEFDRPHFLYWLGPAIRPSQPVASKMTRATRAWADIDLLLTCPSIREAVEASKNR